MRAGSLIGDELWVRCPHCGDSQKDFGKAHLSINTRSGLYHCHRCQASGKMASPEMFAMSLRLEGLEPIIHRHHQVVPVAIRGPGSERQSALDRYHTEEGDDLFYSWWPAWPEAQHAGYYVRQHDGKKRLIGGSGLNWPDAPKPFLSSPDQPLRLVEGPYDVLDANTVCLFGLFAPVKLRAFLKGHYFVLVPDGDVWTDISRGAIFRKVVEKVIREKMGFLGVEFLPQGADPDEGQSLFIPASYFKERLWKASSLRSRVQKRFASLKDLPAQERPQSSTP